MFAIRSSRARRVVLAAFGSLAVAASPASAGVQPVSPTDGSWTATSRPHFAWTADAGTAPYALEVSQHRELRADGGFRSTVIAQQLDPAATSFRPSLAQQLWTGRWYWRVRANDAAGDASSAVREVVVSRRVLRPQLYVFATPRGTSGFVRINTNTHKFRLRVRIVHGRSVCLDRVIVRRRERARLHLWEAFRIYCYPPAQLRRGTVATVTTTLSAGSLARAVTRRDVVR